MKLDVSEVRRRTTGKLQKARNEPAQLVLFREGSHVLFAHTVAHDPFHSIPLVSQRVLRESGLARTEVKTREVNA